MREWENGSIATAEDAVRLEPGVRWRLFDSQLSVASALKAGFTVGDIAAGNEARVLIREISRSVEREVDGRRERWGTALRLVVVAQATKLDGQMSLPVITAKAELSYLSATCELLLLGYDDDEVWGLIPPLGKLGVDTLPEYTAALDRIKDRISGNPDGIGPVLLETIVPPDQDEQELRRSAARLMALRGIADGWSGDRWIARLESADFGARVREQWTTIDSPSATSAKPSRDAQSRADAILRGVYE